MDIEIHDSARKHGHHTDDEMRYLWEKCWIERYWLDDDLPGRQLRICLDEAGRAWEIIGLIFDDGRVLLIHDMQLRKSTMELVKEARRV